MMFTTISPARTSSFALAALGLLAAAPRAQVLLHDFSGKAAGDHFGDAVAAAGDVNGDGLSDLIVGVPKADKHGDDAGVVRVYSGDNGKLLLKASGAEPGDEFGAAVAGPGDIDGDGFADIAVGSPLADEAGIASGRVSVLSGATGALLATWTGLAAAEQYGGALAGVGDVDDDGVPDLAVGTEFGGRVEVVSGADFGALFVFEGLADGDQFGAAVAAAGDVNDDDRPDVVVGAPNGNYVRVFSGADGSVLHTFSLLPLDGGDFFGAAVAGAGDVDDDGFDDIVVGAPFDGEGGTGAGSVTVFSGQTGLELHHAAGLTPLGALGWSVAGLGDGDGDGHADFGAGAPFVLDLSSNQQVGLVRVYSGLDGSTLAVLQGSSKLGRFGDALQSAGDIDGDGRADLVIGAPTSSADEPVAGAVESSSFPLPEFPVKPGDKLLGELWPAFDDGTPDVDAVCFEAVAGTELRLKLSRKSDDLQPQLRLFDPLGEVLVEPEDSVVDEKRAEIDDLELPLTGSYRAELLALDGTAGEYRLKSSARTPGKVDVTVTLDALEPVATVLLGGMSGRVIKSLKVSALDDEAPLHPALELLDPSGSPVDLAPLLGSNDDGTVLKLGGLSIGVLGDWQLRVSGAGGTTGAARVRVVFKKTKKGKASIEEA